MPFSLMTSLFLSQPAQIYKDCCEIKEAVVNNDGWHQIDVFYGNTSHLQAKDGWSSQIKQDETVWQLLHNLDGGYFIDLAANDAANISNTYALETYHNWTGICIEPNPKYWAGLSYRKCQVIAAAVGRQRMEHVHFNYGMRFQDPSG